ncbi:uncharacterized protein [Ambystoma mexicanum]|uniref:uncharacterized protein isoform X2 n=1 Tax=Ambystoma mexicanum TaxID=8296 RepID=UPI0037E91B10
MEDRLGRTEFPSWQDFRAFLDAWCEVRKVVFTVRHCVLLSDRSVPLELAHALRYSSVELGCGSTPLRKTCPAAIKLRLSLRKDRLVVICANLRHNHTTSAAAPLQEMRKNRLLHPTPLANDISKKFLDTHDLKRLLRSPPGSFPDGVQVLKDLDSLFVSDPKAKVKLVFVEDKLVVKSIFVMVSYMQEVAQHFPASLYVDLLPGFSQDFDLYTVLCEEDLSCWKICAYCIARKGISETLRFILVSIMQSIPKMNSQIKHIILSPEIQETVDLHTLLPHATIRYCMPLVLDILYQRLVHLDSTTEDQVKNLLHVMANVDSQEVYYQYLTDLKSICPPEVYQFYYETWHPRRKMWVREDQRSQIMEANIQALVRWKHQAVTSQLCDSPTLDQCLQVVLSDGETTFNLVEFYHLPHPEEMLELAQQVDMDENEVKDKQPEDKKEEAEQVDGKDSTFTLISEGSEIDDEQITDGAVDELLEQNEFYSWDDFCSFLDAWCLERNARFAIRQSVPLIEKKVGAEMARTLKYDTVSMGCEGSNIHTRKKCPAIIQLKLGPQNDKLIVYKTSLSHNHDLQETNLPTESSARKFMFNASHATRLALDISRKFLEWSDLSRLLRFHSIPFEEHSQILKELDSLFVSDPGAKVKLVFLEDKLLVKNIFIMTTQMQQLAQTFPGHLYVDLLPGLHTEFDLYTVFCEDDGLLWHACAYCISRKDLPESLRFSMLSIMQSIPNMSPKVTCVTVSPNVQNPQGLESLVPNASVKYCLPLILELLYSRIAHLDSTTETKIKKCILTLSETHALNIYNRSLNDMRVVCPVDVFNYYYTTWHPCWKLWSRTDNSSQETENRICHYVKAMHEKFLALSDSSLYCCLRMILHGSSTVGSSCSQETDMEDSSHLKSEVYSSCQPVCLNVMHPHQQLESDTTQQSNSGGAHLFSHEESHPLLNQESFQDFEALISTESHVIPAHIESYALSQQEALLSSQDHVLSPPQQELLHPTPQQERLHSPLQEPLPPLHQEPLLPLNQQPLLLPHGEPQPSPYQEPLLPLQQEALIAPHHEPSPLPEEKPILVPYLEPQTLSCQGSPTHPRPPPQQDPKPVTHHEPHPVANLMPTNTQQGHFYPVTSETRLDGREFHSWDDLCSFLDNCCEEKFVIRASENLNKKDLCEMPRGSELAESLKYSSAELYCSRKKCPAFIKLKLGLQKDRLVVSQSSFQHNHDLPDPDNPPPSKKSRLTTNVGLPAHIANNISRKFLEPCDLVRLLRFRSGAFEDRTQVLSELHSLFISDPKARIKLVFVEDKLLVKSIFIMTSGMQDIAQAFSRHLYVDFFPEFSPGFDLYTVLCDQENSGWNVCAHCIAKKNLSDILRFLMVSVFQTIPCMSSVVERVTVHPGIQVPWGLEALLPRALMSYCVPSLLEFLHEKITACDDTLESQVKSCLTALVQTQSTETYDKCLCDLKVLCPPDVLQYYNETWHPRRSWWLQRGEGTKEAERSACAFVKCKQQSFVAQMGPAPSLHQCLHVVLNDKHAAQMRTRDSPKAKKTDTVQSFCEQEMDTTEQMVHQETNEGKIILMKEEKDDVEMSLDLAVVDSGVFTTLPTKQEDEEQLEQRQFRSWHDFCFFLAAWSEERKVEFTTNESLAFTEDEINQYPLGSEVAKSLMYSKVQLGCSSYTGCPAVIQLSLGPQKDNLVVSKAILQHNHDLPMMAYGVETKNNVQKVTAGLSSKIANDISRKFLEPTDLKSLLCLGSGTFEDRSKVLGELDALFISDPWAKVKLVFVADKGLVKNIFIMTSPMLDIVFRFPDHLYVDILPSFSPGFDLYIVLCVDPTLQWKVCAYCIGKTGTPNNLRFILLSVMQSVPKLNTQVKYLTLSPEIQDPLDLESIVPHALVRYCLPLVLELLHQKIDYLDRTTKAQIKNYLHILAHTCSPKVYYKYFDNLKDVCPAEIFQYYSDVWHPRWKFWVKRDSRSEDAESHAHNFLESKRSELMSQIGPSPSLHCSLHVVLSERQTTMETHGSTTSPVAGIDKLPCNLETNSAQAFPLQASEVPNIFHTQNLDTADASDILVPMADNNTPAGPEQTENAELQSLEDEDNDEYSYGACAESDILVNQVPDDPNEECLDRSEFHSWQDFISFLDSWCEKQKVMFTIHHSEALSLEDISQYPLGPEIAKSLRYKSVRLGCRSCSRKSCPALIKLRLGPQKDRLVVIKTILQHNHELSATALPPETKRCKYVTATDLPTRIANDISKKFLEPNDITRLLRYKSGPFEDRSKVLGELKSIFNTDPWVKVKLVYVEDTGMVKDIFIMTSPMQEVAEKFPGHLYIEIFHNFNPGFDLYMVLCADEYSCWKVCAYCIAKRDTSDTLRFTLVSIMQSIPKMNMQVKRITVSPEVLDTLDLETLVPHASVGYCSQSVLKMLYHRIAHLDDAVQVQIKHSLEILAHTHSATLYSQCLNNLIAICPADIFQYYYDIWHPRRKYWVQEQGGEWNSEDCNHLRDKHHMLVKQTGPVSSLHHCLQVILSNSFMGLELKELLHLHDSEMTKEPCAADFNLRGCTASEVTSQSDEGGPCSKEEEDCFDEATDLHSWTGQVVAHAGDLQGMEFPSWDCFCEFFDHWCEERNALFLIRRATPLMEKSPPANLKYSYVRLVCKASSLSRLERSSPGTTSSCPAAIILRASKHKKSLVITWARTDHDHETDATEFDEQFKIFRLLTQPDLSAKMSSLCCTFLTPETLQELMAHTDVLEPALCECLQELGELFSMDPGAQVKLTFLPNTAVLESIFLMTTHTRNLLQSFPSVLFLGRSLAINDTFDLYTVLCEDADGRGRECAYFITRGDSRTPIRFMVVWLLQNIPEVMSRIEGLILRANLKELDLIRDLLPSCCVRMSQTYALDTLNRRASLEEPAIQEKLKKLVYNLVHARTPGLYGYYSQELEAVAPCAFLRYFSQAWNGRKEDWAEIWGHKMRDGHFLEFAAWEPGELRSTGSFPCSLASCIQSLHRVISLQRMKEDMKVTAAQQAATHPSLCSQKEAEQCYAAINEIGGLALTTSATSPGLVKEEDAEQFNATENDINSHPFTTSAASPGLVKEEPDALAEVDPPFADQGSPLIMNEASSEIFKQEEQESVAADGFPEAGMASTVSTSPESQAAALPDPSACQLAPASSELKGREFLSWNEFRDFFDEWCEKHCVLYKIKTYTTLDKAKSSQATSASLITQLRYSYVRLICKNSITAKWSKKRSHWEPSACPSNIILRAGRNCDRLIIEQAMVEHNHEISEEEFTAQYPQYRLKAKPYFLLEVTNDISKQFLVTQDLQKLMERSFDEEPALHDLLRELSVLFESDSKVKMKLVFYHDEVTLEGVFLMTSRMRCLLERFPSILFLDKSLSVNNTFSLYTILCEDADGRGRECAYLLIHKESQTPVRFMMVSLLQSIPNMLKSQIKSVVLHTDLAELDLIRSLLPKRTVVMSQAYALEALYSRVDQEDPSVHQTLKNIIQKLVFAHTSEAFEFHMKELSAASFTSFLTYFMENWHHRKKMWVACWGLRKPERSRFSELVLHHQLMLKSALNPPVTLAKCVSGLLQLQSLKVLTATLNEEKLFALYQTVCPPDGLKLVQEEISLAKQGRYQVTDLEEGFILNDGILEFCVNKDLTSCSCSIYTSSLLPCRHLFAARLWAGEPVFDLRLMQGQ